MLGNELFNSNFQDFGGLKGGKHTHRDTCAYAWIVCNDGG